MSIISLLTYGLKTRPSPSSSALIISSRLLFHRLQPFCMPFRAPLFFGKLFSLIKVVVEHKTEVGNYLFHMKWKIVSFLTYFCKLRKKHHQQAARKRAMPYFGAAQAPLQYHVEVPDSDLAGVSKSLR